MTIPFFRKLYKTFSLSICLTTPLYAQTVEQELKSCKAALLSQINEQKRLTANDCPVSEKLVYWLGILRNPDQFTPRELSAFLNTHAHWPQHEKLCKKAEEVISTKASPEEVLAWFDNHPPQTPEGVTVYGKTLLSHQQKQKAAQVVGNAWQTMALSKEEEKKFLAHFGPLLQEKNHIARLEFLLRDEDVGGAKRLLPHLSVNHQKIVHVRMAFLAAKSDALQQMAALSPQLCQNEGLLYEKTKWHRKRSEYKQAEQILVKASISPLYAEKWWKEQNYIARELIALQEFGAAYKVVKPHNIQPGVDAFSEAEWFAGWLALRFLDKPDVALAHFKTLSAHVKGAISKSRGAYWVGRAYEHKGENELAEKAYAKAACYKTTYYGQLAAAKIKEKPFPILSAAPRVKQEERQRFDQNELVKAAHILKGLGSAADHELSKFLLQIGSQAKTKVERELSVQLAQALSLKDVVWVAKKAGHGEPVLLKAAFPTYTVPQKGQEMPETPLVMAIAYQESRFDPSALSSAGAMGLLQLISTTAAHEAKRLGLSHRDNKLFNPQYNLILGSAHLSRLLNNFMGSYILMMAAYNAGPTPVKRWIKELGDPRSDEVDIIDWIEMIPYYETRNYVMRVLENVTNYRSALQTNPKKTIVDDLKR
ncbi:MAG: lytic transglycosylase domain-containing protein [Alphaproteobacteria bacterium]|nr:lytic transglycosylase domain-containing protein [Alphaproteobacteria bacterium]